VLLQILCSHVITLVKITDIFRKIVETLNITETFWIGVEDKDHDGTWMSVERSTIKNESLFWDTNQPDNSGGKQECARIRPNNFRTDDDHCAAKRLALCEKPKCVVQ